MISQNIFRCRSPPSLERISLTRIAISLWQQPDIRDEIIHSVDSNILYLSTDSVMHLHRVWKPQIEKKVLGKICCLLLPKCWSEVLEGTVKAIGGQLLAFLTSPDPLDLPFGEKAKIYFDNICWTMLGTVNNLKTASLLVENTNVSTREKYILACNNCLDSKIYDLLNKLPADCTNDFIDEIKFRLVLFWTCHVKDDDLKFAQIICQGIVFGFNGNKFILRWAMENKNEVAVPYIWEHFSDDEMRERIVDFTEVALRWPALIDTTFYLFSKMTPDQIEEVCVRKGYVLLLTLIHNWRWHEFFVPVALNVIQYIKKMKFKDALEIVLFCWEENILQRDQYINILNEFIESFANDIKINFSDICDKLLVPLFTLDHVETIKLFINKGTPQDRKKLLHDDLGMKKCSNLIIDNKNEVLALFIKEMLTSEVEIIQFKKQFFEMRSFKICFCLTVSEKYDVLDEFLAMFCTEREISNFKYNLLYGEEKIISAILKNVSNGNTLAIIDKFLYWCCDGSSDYTQKDILSGYRGLLFRHILELTKQKEWQEVEKYLRWIFFTEYKVCKYKMRSWTCSPCRCFRNEDNLIDSS